jgi:hypothetical protein
VEMRLGDGRPSGQPPLTHLTGMDPLAGQIDEALAQIGNVQP